MCGNHAKPGRKKPQSPVTFGAGSARAWGRWFEVIEAGARPVSQRMIDLAEIGPGCRVLDLATGLGEPAASAAMCVGPTGCVDAVDSSAEMLALARERASGLGLRNIAFRELSVESLEYAEATFDAVFCRWGLMFVEDLPRNLVRLRRCLKPGGRLVATVWDAPDRAPTIGLSGQVLRRELGLPEPEDWTMTAFALSDVSGLERTVEDSGFTEVRGDWLAVVFSFDALKDFIEFRKGNSISLIHTMTERPGFDQEAAWEAVAAAASRFVAGDGRVRMTNSSYCIAARA